jgi:hypothetical protein
VNRKARFFFVHACYLEATVHSPSRTACVCVCAVDSYHKTYTPPPMLGKLLNIAKGKGGTQVEVRFTADSSV